MRIIYIVFILLTVVIFNSCYVINSTNGFRLRNKEHYHFELNYSKKDTIIVSDFIMYGIEKHDEYNVTSSYVKTNIDSLFNIIKNKVNDLNIPLLFDFVNINIHNPDFIKNQYLEYKKINFTDILSSANKFENKSVLFPIIRISYSSSTMSESSLDEHYCNIQLAIFIIKNGKITYFKHMSHVESVDSESYTFLYTDPNFTIPIPQHNWDGLVQEVLREYIYRLK
jgi:hypothetical protein